MSGHRRRPAPAADRVPAAQRWFAAKGQDLQAADYRILRRTVIARDLHDADVEQVLLEVTTATGVDVYQLWVGWTWHVPEQVAHATIGSVDGRTAYDALADIHVTDLLLQSVDAGPGFRGGPARGPRTGRRHRHRGRWAW